jgi:ferredoxin
MKAKVDQKLCIGIGNCIVGSCMQLYLSGALLDFKLDSENEAQLLDISIANKDKIMSAAKSCPVNAITIEDDQGNQV